MSSTIRVRYFAKLREIAGRDFEDLKLNPEENASTVYDRLSQEHEFPYETGDLRVAINGQFASFGLPLTSGDEVAFIPPVAGG